MPDKPLFDLPVIKEVLPHRPPFLFVQRVLEFEEGKRIVAEKDFSPEEFFFSGHFPGNPLMPGVIVIEALAQTSGLLIGLSFKERFRGAPEEKKDPLFYLANTNVKFNTPAKPGSTLIMEAKLKKEYGRLFLFETVSTVRENLVASGTLTLRAEAQ